MASPGKEIVRRVKPILSVNEADAKIRVLGLYKAWIRQVRFIGIDYDIAKTEQELKDKVRAEFLKHKDVKDLRIIDMLVIKGQMELRETALKWKTNTTMMMYFRETYNPKPTTFLGKFMSGQE